MRRIVPLLLALACDGTKIDVEDLADTAPATTDSGTPPDTDTDTGSRPVWPADILVDCEGSGDFTEIQPAIEASVSGDRIGVMPCEYHERIDFLGKTIEVYGVEGSAATILDADRGGTAVDFETGEGLGARLAGFTIEDGYDEYMGAAIEISYSSVELEDIVVTESEGNALITIVTGWVDMKDVTLTGNVVYEDAIWVDSGILTAEGVGSPGTELEFAL